MFQEQLHKKISENSKQLCHWYQEKTKKLPFVFYSSFDIRESEFKLAPVDANIFPAGFNNICSQDQEYSVGLIKQYFSKNYPKEITTIGLISEEHTNNPYYLQNVYTLKKMLTEAGKRVKIAFPRKLESNLVLTTSAGFEIEIFSSEIKDNKVYIDSETPDLIVCNNDFSTIYKEWDSEIETPMNPPFQLGWYKRKKSEFFDIYNSLAHEFSKILNIDPSYVTIETEVFSDFNIQDEKSREKLANNVDEMINRLKSKYKSLGIETKPYTFVKNNSGTYGLGVVKVESGDEVRSWNYKSKKKMKAAKGGGGFNEVIIQEGIPTRYKDGDGSAEPTIYMVGCELSGGFLRTHEKKDCLDSLNSPGAIYKRLCLSDLKIDEFSHPCENVLGWISKVSALAIGEEAIKNNIHFYGVNFS